MMAEYNVGHIHGVFRRFVRETARYQSLALLSLHIRHDLKERRG